METAVIVDWALLFVLYFLPSLVGVGRKGTGRIAIFNLLLGWTLIGWVVALVWALAAGPASPVPRNQAPAR